MLLRSKGQRTGGIGIDDAGLGRIFKNFSQADGSTTRKYGGSGLGLAICRRLLDLMGGTIGVQSQPGQGSVFRVDLRLPTALDTFTEQQVPPAALRQPDRGQGQVPVDPSRPGRLRGTLLLVEDNPVNRAVALAMLKRLGLECEVAENGDQALERVRAMPFDLVLMDCQMPVMDGFEATQRIRRLPGAGIGQLPIVALTANTMAGDEQRCISAGMNGFIAKPFTMASLYATLSRWLVAPVDLAVPDGAASAATQLSMDPSPVAPR